MAAIIACNYLNKQTKENKSYNDYEMEPYEKELQKSENSMESSKLKSRLETAISDLPAKKVQRRNNGTVCDLIMLTVLVVTLLFAVSLFVVDELTKETFRKVDYNQKRNLRYLPCTNGTVYDPIDGKVDFIVEFEDIYPDRDVFRCGKPIDEERIVKSGGSVIWHGTHKLRLQDSLPWALFAFDTSAPKKTDWCSGNWEDHLRYYQICCDRLDVKIREMAKIWETKLLRQQYKPEKIKTVGPFKEQRKQGILSCSEVHVHKSVRPKRLNWVNISVVIENPYKKEGLAVSKYPMSEGEELVLSGKQLMWYGFYDRDAVRYGALPKAVFIFESTLPSNSSYRHFYELSCPSLDVALQKSAHQWRKDLFIFDWWFFLSTLTVVGSFGFCFGLCRGKRIAKRKAAK